MAKPTNSFGTDAAIGNREDLSNVIYDINPAETPVVSSIARVAASGINHEWQTEALASSTINANIEGDTKDAVAITPTIRLSNPCQIFRKDFNVTGTQRAVDSAGRADELDYQTVLHGRALKWDIEKSVTSNSESTLASSASARLSAGMESWMKSTTADANAPYTTMQSSATAATSVGFASGSVTAPVDATLTGSLNEAALKQVVRQAWKNGGDPRLIVAGPFNKQRISIFSGVATLQRDVQNIGPGVIIAAADIYVSDFGQHKVIPDRHNRDQTVLVLDTSLWALAELRPMMTTPLAKVGDSDTVMLLTEVCLEARQPLASGKITDLDVA